MYPGPDNAAYTAGPVHIVSLLVAILWRWFPWIRMVLDSLHGRTPEYLDLYILAVAAGEIVEFRPVACQG